MMPVFARMAFPRHRILLLDDAHDLAGGICGRCVRNRSDRKRDGKHGEATLRRIQEAPQRLAAVSRTSP